MDLTRPSFDDSEIDLVSKCLKSGWVTQGPMTIEFENRFAARHNVPFAMATTSCTAALHLATLALQLKAEDEVIVPAFTWVTSAHCAEYVGAKAVFVDVVPETYNIDPKALEAAINDRTKAIVVVHLFGLAAQMDEILAIAKKHNLAVIEDAACAIGTTYNGVPVGGLGDFGCFSFHPRKVVTTGEGGMVTALNEDRAKIIRSLRNHGATGHPEAHAGPARPYTMGTFNRLGFNLRLSDIQAAVGIAQMDKLDRLLSERKHLAERYLEQLADVGEIALPPKSEKCGHTYQSFVIRVTKGGRSRRNRIMDHLDEMRIQTRPGTHAVHRLGYYVQKYGLKETDFPVAAASEDTTITLPIFPNMSESDQNLVVQELKTAILL